MKHLLLFTAILIFNSCRPQPVAESPAAWQKIKLDFKSLDAAGLHGKADGKVALNYEFCIPRDPKKWKEVQRLDPSAERQAGSKGRVGCDEQQWLIIGSTHQKNYQRVLYNLASLPYVAAIQQTFWE